MYDLPDPIVFYKIVWDIVRQIPTGRAATYGQIASMIPTPDGVQPEDYAKLGPRWVGDAMNAVSRVDEPTIPWHRVINGKGGISLPENSKSAALQRARLRAEEVLDGDEKVDLSEFGWEGPDAEWLDAHHLLTPRSLKKAAPSSKSASQQALKPAPQPAPEDDGDNLPKQMSLF